MNLKRHFYKLIIFILLACNSSLQAQDPVYSQFYNSPLQLNPAFAGNTTYPLFHVNSRVQWPNLSNAYTTYSASYDQYFERTNSGLGLNILADDAGNGILKTINIGGIYSYRLRLQEGYNIKIGLEAAYVQTRLDWSKLIFSDQIDPGSGIITSGGTILPSTEVEPNNLNSGYLDISTGFLLYNPLFHIGLGLKHVNNPQNALLEGTQTFIGVPTRFTLHAGMQINFDRGNKVDEGSFISPNVLLIKQGGFYQINIGAYTSIRQLLGGVWYRHTFNNSDAIIFSIGAKVDAFKIQYSFDYTVSELSINSGGTHEIGIKVALESLGPRKSKYNDCLAMFR
jgi:type IX secretion system PorP/SprF family membrane protein